MRSAFTLDAIRQRLAFQILHDEIRRPVLFAHVVQGTDVRVIDDTYVLFASSLNSPSRRLASSRRPQRPKTQAFCAIQNGCG